MGQEGVVDQLVDAGVLVMGRIGAKYNVDPVAVVARNDATGDWNLLMGLPRSLSRLDLYGFIQRELELLDGPGILNDVVIVRDDEAGLSDLISLASRNPPWRRGLRTEDWPTIEVAGKSFNSPQQVRLSPRLFENAVRRILENMGLELISGGEVGSGSDQKSQWYVPRYLQPDFMIAVDESLILIEAKISARMNLANRLLESLGRLAFWERHLGRRVALLIVLAEPPSSGMARLVADLDGVEVVSWALGSPASPVESALRNLAQVSPPP